MTFTLGDYFLIVFALCYVATGYLAVNWAWKQFKRFHMKDKVRDQHFPAYCRDDVYKWKKWYFLPGGMIWFPAKCLLLIIWVLLFSLFIWLLLLGHDMSKPMSPWRHCAIKTTFFIATRLIMLTCFIWMKTKYIDADYTDYLGPRYMTDYKPIAKVSTIVSNHVSYFDVICLVACDLQPAFTPSVHLKKIPLLNAFIKALQSIYIERGGTPEEKERIVQSIIARQTQIEEHGKFSPICVFAEGSTSNGTAIAQFKRGAFMGNKTITPMVLKYHYSLSSPAYDVAPFFALFILNMSYGIYYVTMEVLPPFQPTKYMYETHRDSPGKASKDWEVYAWCLRDAMAKRCQLKTDNQPMRDKLAYERFMQHESNHLVYGGQSFQLSCASQQGLLEGLDVPSPNQLQLPTSDIPDAVSSRSVSHARSQKGFRRSTNLLTSIVGNEYEQDDSDNDNETRSVDL